MDIQILNKVPSLDHKHRLQTIKWNLSFTNTLHQEYLADYYQPILLTMRGIQALFVSCDEVVAAWKVVASIIAAWDTET